MPLVHAASFQQIAAASTEDSSLEFLSPTAAFHDDRDTHHEKATPTVSGERTIHLPSFLQKDHCAPQNPSSECFIAPTFGSFHPGVSETTLQITIQPTPTPLLAQYTHSQSLQKLVPRVGDVLSAEYEKLALSASRSVSVQDKSPIEVLPTSSEEDISESLQPSPITSALILAPIFLVVLIVGMSAYEFHKQRRKAVKGVISPLQVRYLDDDGNDPVSTPLDVYISIDERQHNQKNPTEDASLRNTTPAQLQLQNFNPFSAPAVLVEAVTVPESSGKTLSKMNKDSSNSPSSAK